MIAKIRSGDDRQSERQVLDVARNQADVKHRVARAHRQRKLPGPGHAARGWLDGRESAKMRRDSNAAAGVGAKAERRTAGRDDGGLAAAAPSRRTREVVRVVGS